MDNLIYLELIKDSKFDHEVRNYYLFLYDNSTFYRYFKEDQEWRVYITDTLNSRRTDDTSRNGEFVMPSNEMTDIMMMSLVDQYKVIYEKDSNQN